MLMDPYSILGVSSNASNDEIKKAYRELSRKYHPDSYANNPLSDLAEEKFKEVQEAYDQIMKQREGGYTNNGYSQGSSYRGNESEELNLVVSYINSQRYQEALSSLARIPNRTARWYYYSAIANAGIGNNLESQRHAQQAVNMEPGNREYSELLNQMQFRSQRYQTSSYGYGRPSYGTGNLCCDLWCADTMCECMGGDLIPCL